MDLPDLFQKSSECSKRIMEKILSWKRRVLDSFIATANPQNDINLTWQRGTGKGQDRQLHKEVVVTRALDR